MNVTASCPVSRVSIGLNFCRMYPRLVHPLEPLLAEWVFIVTGLKRPRSNNLYFLFEAHVTLPDGTRCYGKRTDTRTSNMVEDT